jgi:AcrR family transcriptional regulator
MAQGLNRRERLRQATIEEIKNTARRQIAEDGAANLSMGAIARAMGMTPPALYRYFDSRDALVDTLIVEAYDSLGEAMEASGAALTQKDFYGRFLAIACTYRRWAVEHPEDYALMFGVAGSTESAVEQIARSMVRSLRVMAELLRSAYDAGSLVIPHEYVEPPPTVQEALIWMQSSLQDEEISLGILAASFTTWLRAHALVWQELHGPLPAFLFSSGELFEMEIRVLAKNLGLDPS